MKDDARLHMVRSLAQIDEIVPTIAPILPPTPVPVSPRISVLVLGETAAGKLLIRIVLS